MTNSPADWQISGKTVLVTGANSGIGYATALELAKRGANLVLLCRSEQRGRDAVSGIAKQANSSAELIRCDLGDPASIAAAASRFCATHARLDVLINNAGAYFAERAETAGGLEMTFAVNHLGPFQLTHLLDGPLRVAGAAGGARAITVSSLAHRKGTVDFDDLNRLRRRWWGMSAYADSKLMNVLFTRELARRLDGTGVVAHAVHPGVVGTRFGQRGTGLLKLFPLIHWFVKTPEQGAATSVHVATDPGVGGLTGRYFSDSKLHEPAERAKDDELAGQLWDVSMSLIESA